MGCLVDARAYGAVTGAIFRDLRTQNARYVEISFDIVRVLDKSLEVADVVAAMRAAVPPGLVGRVFAAFSQHKPDRTPPPVVEAVLEAPGLDGISLHGDERVQSTPYFAEVFAEARRRGLLTKAHAGELMGPSSVTTALDLLGVRRIEHGVRAVEDDRVVARLATEGITLDVCPWSNVRQRVVTDLPSHPIRRLHASGVRMTLNTDDPTVFGRTLSEEIVSLIDDLGFSPAEAASLQTNAFAVAAMPSSTRAAVLEEIAGLAREIEPGKA